MAPAGAGEEVKGRGAGWRFATVGSKYNPNPLADDATDRLIKRERATEVVRSLDYF